MRTEMCLDMCTDMCVCVFGHVRTDMCIDLCVGMRVDVCMGMCLDMCVSMGRYFGMTLPQRRHIETLPPEYPSHMAAHMPAAPCRKLTAAS